MFHHDQRAHETKQHEAIQAAQDPHSKITADDAERAIVQQTKEVGGAAFHFDANASPAEKAAQAQADVPDNFHHEKKTIAQNLVTDRDTDAGPHYDLPPATTAGAINVQDQERLTGEIAEDARYARDRTGWAPRFGDGEPFSTKEEEAATLLDHQTLLEAHLDEQWFGEWYYNAGVIVFACLSTYITTLLGGGLMTVLIIMAACGTYYRTSLRRVRRNFRDDIRRQVAKEKLESDQESLEWINSFLVKFWPIFAPVMSESIIASVDQVLSTTTPAFLDSLRLKTFILGTKPPRLEHVKTYAKTDPDIVEMDWAFSFNPNDTADMTARQLKTKINPKVVLEIRVGKGIVSKGFDAIVEDMAFSGLMKVRLKLQIPFPHIEKAEICFLNRPTIDYVCKPLGGDTLGFDINFIPGLESFILEQIHANLGPMLYAPNVFPIEIAKIMSGNAVDQAIGVLQITIHGAHGLKNPDKHPGTPDPYVQISVNSRAVIGTTKTIMENSNPQWNETFNVIVTSYRDNLTLQTFDWNEFRKDKDLGTATFALEKLQEDVIHDNLSLEVMSSGHARGVVQADIRFFPVLEAEKQIDGTPGPAPESNTGIARFTVEQAKDLDGSKSLIGTLNPYAVLLLNRKEVQVSQKLKRTNNPIWPDAMKEMLVTDRKSAKLAVVVKDDRDLASDPILGTYQIRLDDMIDLMTRGQEWYNLANTKAGRVKMMLEWKPVAMQGGPSSTSGGYITPIGVMRFHFHGARDLRNLETVGKSDPYVRVLLSGIEKGRTVTHRNNLNPDFDEIMYVPVHHPRERLLVEVMDEESLGRDKTMGQVQIMASDYVHQASNGEYLQSEQKPPYDALLQILGKSSVKGRLNFSCAFFPTIPVEEPSHDTQLTNGVGRDRSPSAVGLDRSPSGINRPSSQGGASFSSALSGRGSLAVPIAGQLRSRSGSDLRNTLNAGESEQHETDDVAMKEAPKISFGAEDLAQYQTGLLVIKVIDAELAHNDCFVDFVVDDMLYPSFRTSKARSKKVTFNETGDALIRELDISRITIRIREKEKDNDNHKVYAKLTGQTREVLQKHLYQNIPLTLNGDDGRTSKIGLHLKYLPVKMVLSAAESINNMGTLRCDILSAADLPAADRNGLSDPYCKVYLNDREVFKTAVQKKTLNPAWNEFFEIPIPSRVAAKFRIDVYDRDLGEKDDFLGAATANIHLLEPFTAQEANLRLDGASGVLRVRFLFRSSYVTRSRIGSATFSGTFSSPGTVVAAPVKGFGRAASTFLSRGFGKKGGDQRTLASEEDDFGTNNTPLATIESANGGYGHGQSPGQSNQMSTMTSASPPALSPRWGTVRGSSLEPYSSGSQSTSADIDSSNVLTKRAPTEQGTVTFSVVSATGFTGHNVRAFIKQQQGKGMKEVHKTKAVKASAEGVVHWGENDIYSTRCTSDTYFTVQLKDVHTFGADQDYGEAPLVVLGGIGGQQTVRIASGTVLVQTDWKPLQQVMDGTNSVSNMIIGTTTTITADKSPTRAKVRKSLGRKGGLLHRERE